MFILLVGIMCAIRIGSFTNKDFKTCHDSHWVNVTIECSVITCFEPSAEKHYLGHIEVPIVTGDELDELPNLANSNLVAHSGKFRKVSHEVSEPLLCRAVAISEINITKRRCV